ncbi:ABC transporter substrate-binding protein [Mucilaginibacter sp. S1162]|uniref:ABC transporter substrate-binding protein n=1 Tax=Mucilaginibacter humi TaxID=2732510 RepID=A0ABX1W0J0_9SPHI|nr:ABC transporter substrate-binding protein [Mucilaginibacter humi]NNU33731.1 ABC transporter substrate-binding protein [Mucilaginibacter humi]
MDLTEEQQERIDIIHHKLKFIEQKPTVACIINLDPLLLAGDDKAELVRIAGGTAIGGTAETMLQLNPDIIILMPGDNSIAQSMSDIDELLQLPGFADLKAIKNNRFYIADAGQYFNNAETDNFVDSIELLAEIIYPKQFIFGHEGQGWIKFSL